MIKCPICNNQCPFFTLKKDRFGQEYRYVKCSLCRFLFDEDLAGNQKRLEEKVAKVYEKEYFDDVDIGWQMRGDGASKTINMFSKIYAWLTGKKDITILDYGAGNGYLTSKLNPKAKVFYYDKYEQPIYKGAYEILEKPEPVDIMCAIELVEHIVDIRAWDFLVDLKLDMFIFSTCPTNGLSDKELVDWNYLKPDSGHTALYSVQVLGQLAKKYGFAYFFFPTINFHIFFRSKFLSKLPIIQIEYFFYTCLRRLKHFLKK